MILSIIHIPKYFVILNSCSNNKEIKYDTLKNKVDPFQIYKEGLEAFNINDFFLLVKNSKRLSYLLKILNMQLNLQLCLRIHFMQ